MPAEEPYHVLADGVHQDTATALSQQSAALMALVAHLINQGSGLDFGGVSGAATSSTKGRTRREKMQQDLAARKSSFFLQVQQKIFKKLHPSKLLPKTEEELAVSQPSLLTYLERYGGYKGQKETGLRMWLMAHAMDAAASNDFSAAKEFLALVVMALEQSAFDAGDWSLAYVLALVEDPPANIFLERTGTITAAGRPFSPLVPAMLASANLSYVKELEVLSTRRSETRVKKPQGASPKGQSGEEEKPAQAKGAAFSEETQDHSRCQAEASHCMQACDLPSQEEVELPVPGHEFNQHRGVANLTPPCFADGAHPEELPEKWPITASPDLHQSSYLSWCTNLTKLVLRSRTYFVSKSSCQRGRLAPAFFPIPVPSAGIFDLMPAHPSRKKRQLLVLLRAVHVIAMAMNFWHFSGSDDLWRRPNAMHSRFYGLTESQIKSDGLDVCFDTLRSGRKNPELFPCFF